MKQFKEFFRSKAFYIAFGTGILAFSGLLLAYNYSDNREGLKQEQTALLNESMDQTEEFTPVESNGVLTGEELDRINAEVLADEEEDIDVEESSTEAESLDGKSEDDNQIETSASTETDAQVASMGDDAAIASQDSSEYSYNGEQSLAWPLNGDVILPYSMDTTVYYTTLKAYKCNPGMLISGSEGTDIVSAYDGVVESVVDDQEHGTIVTVDMGNGYKCSYGQLMNVTVAEGDEVVLGQNLGEVAPVTAYYTEEGTHLYFAMTKDGEPVNPMLYIQ